MIHRRQFLKGTAAALGVSAFPKLLAAQVPAIHRPIADRVFVTDLGANIVTLATGEGFVQIDSGAPLSRFPDSVPNAKIVFNTHYHLDQTGNNEALAASGAKIRAHERTRQWMSTGLWIPGEDRFEPARPRAARPTETFQTTGSLRVGEETIDYGYLPLAHTNGDIYVHFKTSNVMAVGDVASPLRDPELDYFTGAWIGGRMDAMDTILKLANDDTKIVPSYGPVMTRAAFKAERDMMEEVRVRLFKEIREGKGPQELLDSGALKGLPRTWKNPYKFLYDAAKGLWGHHSKIDHNVV